MFPSINPTSTHAWPLLQQHYNEIKTTNMRQLNADDANRFQKFSMCTEDMVFDYSKNIIPNKPWNCWCNWPMNASYPMR